MTHVKICGTANLDDAIVATDAGADLLGFILYPKSPRYVAPETIAAIVRGLRAHIARVPILVGVFVNAAPDEILATLTATGLNLAQLHGDEPASVFAALHGRAFKALRPATRDQSLAEGDLYGTLGVTAGPQLLLDAYDPRAYGGTGHKADWDAAAAVAQRFDRMLLAGGLTPENVAAAISAVQPWGVDVASGVERAPGRKDHDAVRRFIAAAKSAG